MYYLFLPMRGISSWTTNGRAGSKPRAALQRQRCQNTCRFTAVTIIQLQVRPLLMSCQKRNYIMRLLLLTLVNAACICTLASRNSLVQPAFQSATPGRQRAKPGKWQQLSSLQGASLQNKLIHQCMRSQPPKSNCSFRFKTGGLRKTK